MSNNSPCRSPTRTADRCVGDGANRKKRDLCAPSVHLRSSTPATRPRRTPRATSKKQQGLGIGVTCHLRPGGPRSPRHFWYLRVGIRTPGARGPPVQCRSRPLSAPADITAPVDASVSPTTIPPAQRVRPCYQQQQQHQQQAPPPSSGADGTPRCSEVEGRDVMRSFYAQHGSIARYGDGWGATRLLRCGASRGSCRRSSRPAPAQTTFRLHLDYMLPALFGARRDHTLAMT